MQFFIYVLQFLVANVPSCFGKSFLFLALWDKSPVQSHLFNFRINIRNPLTNRKPADQLIKMNIDFFAFLLFFSAVHFVENTEELCFTTDGKIEVYNTSENICCDHGIQPKFDKHGQELKCCANTTYYAQVDICCNGKVFPSLSNEGLTQSCCGSGVYDESEGEKLCCQGNIYQNPGSSKSCCGPSVIDSTKKCCSDDKQYIAVDSTPYTECCLSRPYDTRTEHCYFGTTVLPQNTEICGNQRYNLQSHICCSNQTLYPVTSGVRNGDVMCCGSALVNTQTHRCCSTSTPHHIAPKNSGCCGNDIVFRCLRYFEWQKQRCCQNRVMNAKPYEDCCGSSLYNTKTQGCCGGTAYDKSTHQCCRDRDIQKIVLKQQSCCGAMVMNVSTQVCCMAERSFTVTKTDPSQDSCCIYSNRSSGQPYERSRFLCRGGRVAPINPTLQNSDYCGTTPYNPARDLCCRNKVHKNAKRKGVICCHPGTQVYDSTYQVCCDSVVLNKTDKNACVSGSQDPDRDIQLRSDDVPYDICSICKWRKKHFFNALIDGKIDPCHSSALRLSIDDVRTSRNRRKSLRRTTLEVTVRRNVVDPRNKTLKGKSVMLELPCYCNTLQTLREIVLVTRIPNGRSRMYLGDADWILPFYPRIEKLVRNESSNCRNIGTKELQEVKNFLDFKIRQLNGA